MFARHHGLRLPIAIAGMAAFAGCGRGAHDEPAATRSTPPSIAADTSVAQRWRAGAPPATAVVPRAAVARPPQAAGAGLVAAAEPDTPPAWASAESLPPPRGFKPPILRSRPPLPTSLGAGAVELELWVDARGKVARATWAAGDRDRARVDAAIACALSSTFYPALRDGRPVAAASRQRFEFAPATR